MLETFTLVTKGNRMFEVKFTVITVVFNGEKTIRKTIESVLKQSYKPYEYLIIDGKSNDNTLKIIQQYDDLFFQKGIVLKIISEHDTGIYNAMNKGIRLATGEFISFLNSGDWYELDALENIFNYYKKDSFDLIYGSLNYVRPDGTKIIKKSKFDEYIISSRNWNHPSMFLKSDFYKAIGFDESFDMYSDFDLYLKIRKRNDLKIKVIDKIITNFVADGVSTSVDFDNVLKKAKEKYVSYKQNGYSRLYWIEAYGWEFFKCL